jgi:hypothetical protein
MLTNTVCITMAVLFLSKSVLTQLLFVKLSFIAFSFDVRRYFSSDYMHILSGRHWHPCDWLVYVVICALSVNVFTIHVFL